MSSLLNIPLTSVYVSHVPAQSLHTPQCLSFTSLQNFFHITQSEVPTSNILPQTVIKRVLCLDYHRFPQHLYFLNIELWQRFCFHLLSSSCSRTLSEVPALTIVPEEHFIFLIFQLTTNFQITEEDVLSLLIPNLSPFIWEMHQYQPKL